MKAGGWFLEWDVVVFLSPTENGTINQKDVSIKLCIKTSQAGHDLALVRGEHFTTMAQMPGRECLSFARSLTLSFSLTPIRNGEGLKNREMVCFFGLVWFVLFCCLRNDFLNESPQTLPLCYGSTIWTPKTILFKKLRDWVKCTPHLLHFGGYNLIWKVISSTSLLSEDLVGFSHRMKFISQLARLIVTSNTA